DEGCRVAGDGDAAWAGSTYYWTSSRLWEFALGGLLTLVPEHICHSRLVRGLAVLSLVVLVAGAFIPIPDSTHYLVPAALCAAFPLIGAKEGRLNTLLSLAPLRWVGTISFSLYLVHWPLISVAEYVFYAPLTWERAAAVMLLTLCLAYLLYYVAESRRWDGRRLTAGAVALLLACLLISRSAVLMRYLGAPSWLHLQNVPTLQKEAADSPLWQETDEFVLNRWGRKFSFAPLLQHMGSTDAEACFVLLGDSHAQRWAYGLNLLAREQGWSGVYLNSYYHPFYGAVFDPPATPDFKNTPERCETLFRWLRHQQGLRWVIIGNYWCGRYIDHATWDGREVTGDAVDEARTAELREFCRKIRDCGKEVLILGDTPHVTGNDTMRLANWNARYGRYGLNQVSLPQVRREEFDREVRAPQASFRQLEQEGCCHVLLPGDNMFTNGVFTPLQDGQVLLEDSDHLTVEGSYWALQFVLPQLKSLLGAEER
ncbi:MAG: acyltransferase, partial [Akkermansia sp.]|nr:acyltransferase [Akkermansia sp.]